MNKIAIVSAPYHDAVREMQKLIEEGLSTSAGTDCVAIREVPGSWEIPYQLQKLLAQDHIEGAIVVGAIERGETGHGVAIARAVFDAVMQLSLEFRKPVSLAIIGPGATREQINSRAENVGKEALAAIIDSLQD